MSDLKSLAALMTRPQKIAVGGISRRKTLGGPKSSLSNQTTTTVITVGLASPCYTYKTDKVPACVGCKTIDEGPISKTPCDDIRGSPRFHRLQRRPSA